MSKDDESRQERNWLIKSFLGIGFSLIVLIFAGMAGCPIYAVWQQKLTGEAELKRAEGNRQIKVQEAKAADESATYWANAEVKRASGVAKANEIIGESLKNNEAYLRWLFIEGMKSTKDKQIIYIPTEANLPILEAGRLKVEQQPTHQTK